VMFFFQAEDGIRDFHVTGVQTCALPISWGTARKPSVDGMAGRRPLPHPGAACTLEGRGPALDCLRALRPTALAAPTVALRARALQRGLPRSPSTRGDLCAERARGRPGHLWSVGVRGAA